MARLGVLKPLRGTSSSLADIVLENGEIAFTYPSTGPGTGYSGIKIGDGTNSFKDLDWYIQPQNEWEYDEGTDEAALLHNLEHPEQEQIGKIYYIQSYMNAGTKYAEGTPTIQESIPYMVIGVNHEGMNNTVDLMSCVAVNYIKWNSTYNSWSYGKYSTSGLYNWVGSTCQNGYSSNIQSKMLPMIERWREATGNATGVLQTRSTKCKLLNPVELFGTSAATYDPGWEYASSSDHKTKFTTDNYGTQYSIWSNSTGADTNRVRYHNTAMLDKCNVWTNSWLAFNSSDSHAYCFGVNASGACSFDYVSYANGVAPVLRLSAGYSDWTYNTGTDEAALLNNIKHPEYEQLGKIYYIQSYMTTGNKYQEGTSTIQQGIPYMVIGINHDGTSNTVDLMSCVAVDYNAFDSKYESWKYGRYTTSWFYDWVGSTCQDGYSSNIRAKMCNMTERWREATDNNTGTLQTRSTKCKLLNPVELFGSSAASYTVSWAYGKSSDHKTKFLSEDYGAQYPIWSSSTGSLKSRRIFHDKAMSTASYYWTNSWFAFNLSDNCAICFHVDDNGSFRYHEVNSDYGIAPVIRLSDSPE
jgi:hypothetical protein